MFQESIWRKEVFLGALALMTIILVMVGPILLACGVYAWGMVCLFAAGFSHAYLKANHW